MNQQTYMNAYFACQNNNIDIRKAAIADAVSCALFNAEVIVDAPTYEKFCTQVDELSLKSDSYTIGRIADSLASLIRSEGIDVLDLSPRQLLFKLAVSFDV